MTKIYSLTRPVADDIVDAFCSLQKGFTDQFVYYRTRRAPVRYHGAGALHRACRRSTRPNASWKVRVGRGQCSRPKGLLPLTPPCSRRSSSRSTGSTRKTRLPTDELFEAFPRLKFMLPEIVLIENERGTLLQVNSLGPVYRGPHGALHAPGPGSPVPLPHRHPVPAGTRLARRMAGRGRRRVGRHWAKGAWTRWCCRDGRNWWPTIPFPRRTCWLTS